MKRLLFSLQIMLVAMLVASVPSLARAQSDMDLQPGVVISITNVEEHLSDIEHLMEAAGVGQMAGLVRMGVAEYIRGIDADKPFGALLFFDEENPEEPNILGFLPVTDIEDVLDTLAPFVDIDEEGDDIILTMDDDSEVFVRVNEGYAIIVQDPEFFDDLPGNPAALLNELPSQYNLAARVFGQNIPESLRDQAIELIRSGAEGEMSNLGDGPEAEIQRANFEYSMAQVESFINDTEEVVAGLAIDEDNNRIYIDVNVIGLEGSVLANQSNILADAGPSNFSGFIVDGSSANLHFCGKFTDDDVKQIQDIIETLGTAGEKSLDQERDAGSMSDDEADAAKKVLANLMDVLRGSVAKGYMDMGASLVFDDDSVQLAMGLSIAEGAKLDSTIKEVAAWAESEGAPVEFNFDVENENGVRYHQIHLMIPDSEEEVQKMFGEKVEIILGIGDEVLYVAAGDSPGDLLAKCIEGSSETGEDGVVGQFNMHLLPIMKFAATFQDSAEMQGIADALPDDAEDRIRMTVRVVENGQQYRFEMEDAVLKIFTELGQAMGGGFGPPQDF